MKPPEPDHYRILGLSQQATMSHIRKAYRRLALIHHPDKKAPGQSIDAVEFRKISDAKDLLSDEKRRARYDERYSSLRDEWTRFEQWQAAQQREEFEKQAREEHKKARAAEKEKLQRQEDERKAAKEKAETDEKRKLEQERLAALEKVKLERLRAERIRHAEERSREAARRAREQQEEVARERVRKQKQAEAERRSREAIRRRQAEQAREAAERLVRSNWAHLRETAEQRRGSSSAVSTQSAALSPSPSPSAYCAHPMIRWPKIGRGICFSCGAIQQKR